MTLSVIVPIYNAEPHLTDCLESIHGQLFTDFELLLVDDGSTDASGKICDAFSKKDPRIRVFHKDNGGVSSSRNKGLNEAKGDYIVFIDADDYVSPMYLEHLMESDSDLVLSGIKKFGHECFTYCPNTYCSFSIKELPSHWNTVPRPNILYCFPVAKKYRHDIIKQNNIRFDEHLFFSEDCLFNLQYMCHCKSFTELPYMDYMYRIENISRNEKFKMSAEQLIIHYGSLTDGLMQLQKKTTPFTLDNVRNDLNLRLVRKFFFFLTHCRKAGVFVKNIRLFNTQKWSRSILRQLVGKKEKRIMNEAVRFPLLTYAVEVRLKGLLGYN